MDQYERLKIAQKGQYKFYGKNAQNISRGHGIMLSILGLFIFLIDRFGDSMTKKKFDLSIMIKDKQVDFTFVLILTIACIIALLIIKGFNNKTENNYIELFNNHMEIKNQQDSMNVNVLADSTQTKNTVVHYTDIDHIELNSIGFERNAELFNNLGIRNFLKFKDNLKDVCIKKKDGSEIRFPELNNRQNFYAILRQIGIQVIINNSSSNKNVLIKNFKSKK